VTEGHNGSIHVNRNGHTATFRAPKHNTATSVDTVLAVRHFLETSTSTPDPRSTPQSLQLLVVIDHQEARIFRTESHGTIPQQLVPYDPHGFRRHLRSEVPETAGKRTPERKSFYENIVASLRDADEILIFGTGTGKSSAMDHLVAELNKEHGDIAPKVIGTVVVDEHHLSEPQLLAQAREFFASNHAGHKT
jgi:hypothetical protein